MTQKPTRTPPSNDAAKAFADLRLETSLQRTAIEGLTAMTENCPITRNLHAMESRLDRMDERLHSIDQQPALQFTPLTLAAEMFEASKTVAPTIAKPLATPATKSTSPRSRSRKARYPAGPFGSH